MVKKEFCDRCGKEIESSSDEFAEMFDEISSKFDKSKRLVLEPHLCWDCENGYEKIIAKTNKEIKLYLEEGKKENKKEEPKKKKGFGFFK